MYCIAPTFCSIDNTDITASMNVLQLLDVLWQGILNILNPFILVHLSLDIVGLLSASSGKNPPLSWFEPSTMHTTKRKAERLQTNDGGLLYKKRTELWWVTICYYSIHCIYRMLDLPWVQMVECTKCKEFLPHSLWNCTHCSHRGPKYKLVFSIMYSFLCKCIRILLL